MSSGTYSLAELLPAALASLAASHGDAPAGGLSGPATHLRDRPVAVAARPVPPRHPAPERRAVLSR